MYIAVLGSINADIVMKVDTFAGCNETVLGERDYRLSQGGKGANQAAATAAAGIRTHMIGRVGDDSFGASARANLAELGVNCDGIAVTAEATTGLATILVDKNGNNIITVASGANALLAPEDVEQNAATIRGAAALVVQLETPLATIAAAIDLAHANDVPVILNPAPAPLTIPAFLDKVDVLIPNQHEARQLAALLGRETVSAEEAAETLLASGVKAVVVTLGDDGCLVKMRGRTQRVFAYSVEALDTTGAGDVFCGYLTAAIARGEAILDAARAACAAGAIAVTRAGARAHLPTRAEVAALARR